MKVLVGKRSNPDPELKTAVALVESLLPTGPKPTKRLFPGSCIKCGALVETSLTERVGTGEIWAEGPNTCPNCGHQLADENVTPKKMLSQEAIVQLFGKY